MRISDWSSDVCSSDLRPLAKRLNELLILSESIIHESLVSKIATDVRFAILLLQCSNHANINATSWISKKSYRSLKPAPSGWAFRCRVSAKMLARSEEHTSELQSLMRISYAVFCLKKKN